MHLPGFGQTLTRASLVPLALFTSVAAYLLPSAFVTGNLPDTPPSATVLWKAAYSEKFPGCVSTVLWPVAEKPVALLVLDSSGRLLRVSSGEARHMAAMGELDRTIGACRRPG